MLGWPKEGRTDWIPSATISEKDVGKRRKDSCMHVYNGVKKETCLWACPMFFIFFIVRFLQSVYFLVSASQRGLVDESNWFAPWEEHSVLAVRHWQTWLHGTVNSNLYSLYIVCTCVGHCLRLRVFYLGWLPLSIVSSFQCLVFSIHVAQTTILQHNTRRCLRGDIYKMKRIE